MMQYKDLIDRAAYVGRQGLRFRNDARRRSVLMGNEIHIPSIGGVEPTRLVFDRFSTCVINYHRPKIMSETTISYLHESLRNKIRLYRKFVGTRTHDIVLASVFVVNTHLTADDAHLLHQIVSDCDDDKRGYIKEMLNKNIVMSDEAFDILHDLGYRMNVMEHFRGCATGNLKGYISSPPRMLPTLTTWPPYFTNVDTVRAYAKFSITPLSVLIEGAKIAGMSMDNLLWYRHIDNAESTVSEFVDTICKQTITDAWTWKIISINRAIDAKTCDVIHETAGGDSRYICLPLEAPSKWWDRIDDSPVIAGRRAFSEDCAYDRVAHLIPANELYMMYGSLYKHRCQQIAVAVANDWRDRAFIPGGREYHLTLMHLAD